MISIFAYRGDNRTMDEIRKSGGFVPKYLLEDHAGGFEGFKACPDKTDGRVGCNCPGMREGDLLARARQKLLDVIRDPMILQEHVISNNKGFLSTATCSTDAYEVAHKYKVTAEFEFVDTVAEVREKLKGVIKGGRHITAIASKFQIAMNKPGLSEVTLIAALTHGGVEWTFLSPIPCTYLTVQS